MYVKSQTRCRDTVIQDWLVIKVLSRKKGRGVKRTKSKIIIYLIPISFI